MADLLRNLLALIATTLNPGGLVATVVLPALTQAIDGVTA